MQTKQNYKYGSSQASPDFRRYLQQELIRRCHSNPNYSLRAFARAIGIYHATLSAILADTRPLTTKAIVKISKALKLSDSEIKQYLFSMSVTKSDQKKLKRHEALALDVFSVVADWYHDAILELIHTTSFQPEPKWIAQCLGITKFEVIAAKERLERLDLLEITSAGAWIDRSRNNTTNITNDLTSAALRKLQQNILALSSEALTHLSRTERDHTSITIAMQASDLSEIKEKIKIFRFELAEYIERKGAKPDSVYQFAFSAFPLTKLEHNKDGKKI